jgi:acyl-coenzyme A synthetase/AMP-(fatty) acid ligase
MTRTAAIMASYDHGAGNQPLLGETIGENFNRMAMTHADREALVDRFTGRRWTYAKDFPMTASGKVRKVEMREAAVSMLGLTDIAASQYA